MTETRAVNTASTRRIVRDLTEKYPAGPHGILRKNHYRSGEVYSEAYRRLVPAVVLDHAMVGRAYVTEANIKHFGYEPLELFKLGVSSEDSSKSLIVSLYPTLRGPGITRKARLLWMRVREAVRHIMREGTEGIWVASSYHAEYGNMWRHMQIWGTSRADVEAQVRLIGPMTGLRPEWNLEIKFNRLGTRDEATTAAASLASDRVNRIKRDIETHRKSIIKLEKELEEETLAMNRNLGGVMLLAGTEDDEQEVAQ